jgi:hypothetical protein
MQVLYAGMAVAAAIGALAGAGMQVDPYQLGDRPNGPQQIYSMPVEYGHHEAWAYSMIEFPSGPYADFVIGTDWLPGGRHDRPIQVSYAPYDPSDFELTKVDYYLDDLDIPSPPAPPPLELEAKAATDAAQEAVEIVRADHQAGSEVDDLAHGPDEAAFVGKPPAEGVAVYGSVEFDHPDGA